jgi:hypothetical protein
MKRLFRNANVGIAVAVVLLIVGFWPVHRSEDASTALGLAAFAVGIGVSIALNIRDDRARARKGPRHVS